MGDGVGRRGVDHPSPSSVGVKEKVELHLYSNSVPSWRCPRVKFTYFYAIEEDAHLYITLMGL